MSSRPCTANHLAAPQPSYAQIPAFFAATIHRAADFHMHPVFCPSMHSWMHWRRFQPCSDWQLLTDSHPPGPLSWQLTKTPCPAVQLQSSGRGPAQWCTFPCEPCQPTSRLSSLYWCCPCTARQCIEYKLNVISLSLSVLQLP